MYKHKLRKKVFEKGQWRTKIVHTDAELGSGILDKNGKEIFEGDRVKEVGTTDETISTVEFNRGDFTIGYSISLSTFEDGELEVVGHAED